jgi:hypothetical protein
MHLVLCIRPRDPIQRSHQTDVINLGMLLGEFETLPMVWTWLSPSLLTIHCTLTICIEQCYDREKLSGWRIDNGI